MVMKFCAAAAISLALASGSALAQSSTEGTAPGVPGVEVQKRATNPDEADKSDRGSRSEREARDDLGAKRATGDQLGPPAGIVPGAHQVQLMLEKQGYTDIQDLKEQGGGVYTGRARKDGQVVNVRIDPQQAKIEETGK